MYKESIIRRMNDDDDDVGDKGAKRIDDDNDASNRVYTLEHKHVSE